MTTPGLPSPASLLARTDLAIKDLAYKVDAKLAGFTSMFTSVGTAQTDVNGEFVVDFHTAKTLTGCLILNRGVRPEYPQLRRVPGSGNYDNMGKHLFTVFPRQYLTNGLVWVRTCYGPVRLSGYVEPQMTYGAQSIEAGVTIYYTAFGWAP